VAAALCSESADQSASLMSMFAVRCVVSSTVETLDSRREMREAVDARALGLLEYVKGSES